MQVSVQIVNDKINHKLKLPASATPLDTLKKLQIPPDTVIVVQGGIPIPIDARLKPNDELAIIRVVSGG